MKLTWCHNRLAIGNSPDSQQIGDVVADAGITHVINCRRNPVYAQSLDVVRGIAVLWNPTEDDGLPKPAEWFGRSIDFALSALASPRSRVAVVCCEGNNRSPSTALAILMAQGLRSEDALDLILNERPTAEILYSGDAKRAVKELGYC